MKWKVGDLFLCIDDTNRPVCTSEIIKKGNIYKVIDVVYSECQNYWLIFAQRRKIKENIEMQIDLEKVKLLVYKKNYLEVIKQYESEGYKIYDDFIGTANKYDSAYFIIKEYYGTKRVFICGNKKCSVCTVEKYYYPECKKMKIFDPIREEKLRRILRRKRY